MLLRRLLFIRAARRYFFLQNASSSISSIGPLNAGGGPLLEESYAQYMERATAATSHWFLKFFSFYETNFGSDKVLPAPFRSIRDRLYMKVMTKQLLDNDQKANLSSSISLLYYSCSNATPYIHLIREFGLRDQFFSWFVLTMLHNWAVCTRLSVSLDAPSYLYFYRSLLGTFWTDTDKRMEIIRDTDPNYVGMGFFRTSVALHSLHIQLLIDLDEGFLGDDQALAAGVWRSIYCLEEFRPIHVNNIVKYIRQTMHFLHNKSTDELLQKGLSRWEPAEEIKLKHVGQ